MQPDALLSHLWNEPSPDVLWNLHPYLLAVSSADAAAARELARTFFCYLGSVRSKLTSKQYSALAAALAAGSVSVIALHDVVKSLLAGREQLVYDLLAGSLSASLETLSTGQHIKAWQTEFLSVHDDALWALYAAWWQFSAETQPDLLDQTRRELIDRLLAPARDLNTPPLVRTALIIRLFQVLLALRLVRVFDSVQATVTEPET